MHCSTKRGSLRTEDSTHGYCAPPFQENGKTWYCNSPKIMIHVLHSVINSACVCVVHYVPQ